MNRRSLILAAVATVALALQAGCQPQQPFYFHEGDDLSHYKGMATEIQYPDDKTCSIPDVDGALPPLTLSHPDPKEIWELSLEEAMHTALANSKVMKKIGANLVVSDYLLTTNSTALSTVYSVASQETDPIIGVESALAAFDAQFQAAATWGKIDEPQNISPLYNNFVAPINVGDTATVQAKLQKIDASGGTVSLTHDIQYLLSNNPEQEYGSAYTVDFVAEIRQPLLQGAGVEYNRIAGPGSLIGRPQGVMLARLRTDIALADFEASVRNLTSDVENAYWELYNSYRSLDTVLRGRDAALGTWKKIYGLYIVGAKGGEADKEAQAREQYFLFRSSVEQALAKLYTQEGALRYIMGLASTDGRLIRPSEEPTTAKVEFDWYTIHSEALVRSVELRKQKWTIKQRELELVAAKNWLLPRLDAVGRYRWIGMGNQLYGDTANGEQTVPASFAYTDLLTGHYQEWTVGFEASIPLGFRKEMSNVRNAQLAVTRDRAVLQEQELELSHLLADAVRNLDTNYVLSQTNFNRRLAAEREVKAVEAAYDTGNVTLDVLLNAQRLLAQADSDYYHSLSEYMKAIAGVHFRKGSLLEYNGVMLAEGPWPGKAYFDACRNARDRAAGHPIDYGLTRPAVVSRGAYQQQTGETSVPAGVAPAATAVPGSPEMVPLPQPLPAAPAGGVPSGSTSLPRANGAGLMAGNAAAPAGAPSRRPAAMNYAMDDNRVAQAATVSASPAAPATAAVTAAAPQTAVWTSVHTAGFDDRGRTSAGAAGAAANSAAADDGGSLVGPSLISGGNHDSNPDTTADQPDRSAAGWKAAQR